ncbi:MAG: hypothetical protein M1821_003643 [Bathelium mastoideum]|nr:MAG: hypothetical protein M1821_003643 [Bathelium mastoideum]
MSTTTTAIAQVKSLDHLVLTVKDIPATISFYEKYLGMKSASFTSSSSASPPATRYALSFGTQKINLHQLGAEFEPKAKSVCPGSADLCFVADKPVDQVLSKLKEEGIEVLEGGEVVERTGAVGKIRSVYIRDPDGNLIEYALTFCSNVLIYSGVEV